MTDDFFDGIVDGIFDFLEGGTVMSLTDIFIKNLKRPEKPKKYSDYNGLCLYASPAGLKSRRFDCRFQDQVVKIPFVQVA